jgi:hypothetical protein
VPIVADLEFLVELTLSIAVVALPIVLIVRLLVGNGDHTVSGLFILPTAEALGPGPADEDPAPRWRPELIRARHRDRARGVQA